MPSRRPIFHAVIMLAAVALPGGVAAEHDAGERLERANARAISAYRLADVRGARSQLSRAARSARRAGVRGAALARTYVNLGVVLAEGAHSHERAVRAFRRALAEEPGVVPEPELRTSAVMAAFGAAGGTTDRWAREQSAEPTAAPPPARHVPTASEVAERDWQRTEAQQAERAPEPRAAPGVFAAAPPLHDEEEHGDAEHEHPRWFVEMGVGLGFSALRDGHAPDRLPESETLDELVASTMAKERTEHGPHAAQEDVTAHVERELREEGWECEAVRADAELRAEDCRVASRRGVSVMEPIFDMAFGYHVLPRFALALTALVQRNHGEGPMAGVLVGLRSEYMLTTPAERGIQLGAIAGLGVGSLQARSRSLAHHAPHATNGGPGGIGASVALGVKGAYRTNQHLSFSVMPLFNIGLPYVLYDMGLTGGVEVAF